MHTWTSTSCLLLCICPICYRWVIVTIVSLNTNRTLTHKVNRRVRACTRYICITIIIIDVILLFIFQVFKVVIVKKFLVCIILAFIFVRITFVIVVVIVISSTTIVVNFIEWCDICLTWWVHLCTVLTQTNCQPTGKREKMNLLLLYSVGSILITSYTNRWHLRRCTLPYFT